MTPLDDLLRREALDIHFQPIISLKQRMVVGLEALARPHTMGVAEMFNQAANIDCLLELDRLCRRKAFEEYRELSVLNEQRPLLFVNFEASVVDEGVVGSGAILSSVEASGLQPSDIVIEINESKVVDTAALKHFVDQHRELGFLIALDDLGAEYSNLSRIVQLRPHIIKLDRDLIAGIDGDFFKRETMKSLVHLCRNIGSLVLVEGVETLEEVDTCAVFGADLFQGFYFARPLAPQNLDFVALQPTICLAAHRLRERAVHSILTRRLAGKRLRSLAEQGRNLLIHIDPAEFDNTLAQFVQHAHDIEAAYLLDHNGLQISDTYLGSDITVSRNRLFSPASRGADHSNKEYFFSLLDAGLERYTTDNYLSLATGQPCRTIAVMLNRVYGQKYILCIDFNSIRT